MALMLDEEMDENVTTIKVVGVGGGGGNAVNRMVADGLQGVEFIAMNTDQQALNKNHATIKVQLGSKLTKGRGAGADPEVGQRAAEESKDEIANVLKGAQMVFITAGMGGGTGTGAAPVVAEVAHDLGVLTVGIVTKPFAFEGKRKMGLAEQGIANLLMHVDSLIVIPNERLKMISQESSPLLETSIAGAHGVIINITSSPDIGLEDIETAAGLITQSAHPDANIIWGTAFDENLSDEMRVTVVATGFDNRTGDALRSALDNSSAGSTASAAGSSTLGGSAGTGSGVVFNADGTAPGSAKPASAVEEENSDNRYYDELLAILNKRK